jgi:predicted transcriptional regulator
MFDKSDQWARDRMNELMELGYVNAKKPGHKSRVYWITEEGHRYYAESLPDESQ